MNSGKNTENNPNASYAGGVVGQNKGSTVTASYNAGAVSGSGDFVGGVVGYNTAYYDSDTLVSTSTVSAVYNTGSISGTGYDVGGVVGGNKGSTVTDSYNTGSVSGYDNVGGVVGYNDIGSSISAVYNTGSISETGYYFGGVVGYNDDDSTANGFWLEGTNLMNSGLGTGTTTTFSGITGDGTTLSAIYTSMTAIASSARGSATGAITAISFSGVDTPSSFDPLQGAYITSAGSLTITVTAVAGTTLTVTTASSLATLLTPGGATMSGESSGSNTTYQLSELPFTVWMLIKAVNTDAKLNRSYVVIK